jgi:hypothetical protein
VREFFTDFRTFTLPSTRGDRVVMTIALLLFADLVRHLVRFGVLPLVPGVAAGTTVLVLVPAAAVLRRRRACYPKRSPL